MFSDLVGSTALSARMDPEDLREVFSAYQFCSAHFRGVYTIWHRDGLPAASQLRRYANLKQQRP